MKTTKSVPRTPKPGFDSKRKKPWPGCSDYGQKPKQAKAKKNKGKIGI
ncbi:MAG: hypothetical protein JRF49_07970 [Deltaproteobacteria bacterium]|nr:hypothetical protein [Deltaproteobacteria bacterium]